MMWLAANLDSSETDIIALPHSQASAKGQDSLIVHPAGSSVAAVTICEDKATVNPRKIVRDDVWPEIATYEKGERADELRSGVISFLCHRAIELNAMSFPKLLEKLVAQLCSTARVLMSLADPVSSGLTQVIPRPSERQNNEKVYTEAIEACEARQDCSRN